MDEKRIVIGRPFDKKKIVKRDVYLPLNTMTMHGMIGGATGTGKSRAIQVLAEELMDKEIPVILADIKGDMSGFVRPSPNPKTVARAKKMGIEYSPKSFPTNFFSVSGDFIPFRISLEEVDPALLARVLHLNSTQEANMKIALIYARKKDLKIRNLVDLQEVLEYILENPEKVRGASKTSIRVVLRQISIAISDGINEMFGEPSISIEDLLKSRIHILNLSNWRKRIEMPSILMGFILAKLFNELPDIGHVEKPKVVLFIDEAHYLFQGANPSLVKLFVTILKQIRSKGVAVFYSSQNPEDIPEKILEQLGCKVMFALRAFTKEELEDIKGIANAFPPTKMKLAQVIRDLGVGEAIVSPLDEKGKPQDPLKTFISPPRSYMKVVPADEVKGTLDESLMEKYKVDLDLERIDLSEPLKLRYIKPSSSKARKEARKYELKQQRMVRAQWKKLKMIGIFVLVVLFLIIIILLLLAAFVWK
jgi:DNA helicase HerA-like ATPase